MRRAPQLGHIAAQMLFELIAHVLRYGAILLRAPVEEVRVMRLHQRDELLERRYRRRRKYGAFAAA